MFKFIRNENVGTVMSTFKLIEITRFQMFKDINNTAAGILKKRTNNNKYKTRLTTLYTYCMRARHAYIYYIYQSYNLCSAYTRHGLTEKYVTTVTAANWNKLM